jgi:aerobic carbon-monoxide dehydrogenase large subunit
LRGQGRFVHNLKLPDLFHVAFARSDHAVGSILDLDFSDAKSMPGVVAVLGIQELGRHFTPAVNPLLDVREGLRFPLLADSEVRMVGQILAVVVASNAGAAANAAQAVRMTLQEEQNSELTLGGGAAKSCMDFESEELATQVAYRRGVAADAQVQSVSINLISPRVQAFAMEPRASLVQWNEAEQHLTIWMGTQTPSRAQADLALVLGLDLRQVRVITPDVGGAFGAKASIYPEDLLLALSARHLKANLRWLSSRSEEFSSAMHGRGSKMKGSLAFSPLGKFLELKADLHFTLGAWMPFSSVVPLRNAARILPGPYLIERIDIKGKASLSNAAPVNIYRGAGRPEATLLMETLIEQAARASHLDPIELRRRNLIPVESMPYQTLTGETFDSGNYLEALNRACEKFNYQHERAEQLRRRALGELVGIGTSIYVEPCGQGWESARVTLHCDGKVTLASGSPAQGQGHQTGFARIAANTLSCPEEDIEVVYGDTDQVPLGLGTLASRSTAIGGSAIVKVCREALALRARGHPLPITVEDRFVSEEAWGYGCLMARLSIDRDTGAPKVERVVWVDDAGQVIHPTLAKGQMLGGLAQGFGQAMMERIVYDEAGQLLTGSLMDYAVPRVQDVPGVELESLCHPAATNLLGAKGVGEAGCIGVPAVLMNAARDALAEFGAVELQFPLTAEQLWRAQNHKN